jgi:hypothetical protein
MIGTTLGPDAAYLISKGGEVTSSTGWRVKLNRPLDFVVVADHAENLGLADFIRRSDPIILANEKGKKWHDMVKAGKGYDAFLEWLRGGSTDQIKEPRMMESVWPKVVENADREKEYARSALNEGLRQEKKLGTTPFKFGMIGSTDNHTAMPTTREENNFSKASFVEPSATRFEHPLIAAADPALSIMQVDVGAAGLAAVWARENTRESVWDARHLRKPSRQQARTWLFVYLAAGISRPTKCLAPILPEKVTSAACQWAAICRIHPKAKHRHSWFVRCVIRTAQ